MNINQTTHEIIVKPPDAHSDKQRFIFTALQHPGLKEVWIAAGTKFGKTIAATVAQINLTLSRKKTKNRWVAPIYSQTRQPIEYFRSILPDMPKNPMIEHNKSENIIYFNVLNSRFEFWHAQNPSSLEGEGIDSYVFDEAAKQPPEIYSSARTTTTATKGHMIFISYPFGKNWFYNRGETSHFVEKCEVLEKNFGNVFNGKSQTDPKVTGRVIDTIYVVIN